MKSTNSMRAQAYKRILMDILSMKYPPGSVFCEKDIIECYEFSRSPVREALQQLCMEEVIRSIPRYGYEVIRLTRDDVLEIMQYRYVLESGILQLRYKQLSDKQLDIMYQLDDKCSEPGVGIWEHWERNVEFHLTLHGFCGNSYSVKMLNTSINRLKRAYAQYYFYSKEDPIENRDTAHHRPLLDALKRKDIKEALSFLSLDLSSFADINSTLNIQPLNRKTL